MAEGRYDDDDMHQDMHEGSDYRRIEVITGRRKRRSWTAKEKAAIVAASAEPGANISDVARHFDVNRGLLSVWRRQAGLTAWTAADMEFVPIAVPAREPADTAVHAPSFAGVAAPGRVELEVDGARLVMTGGVDPALAGAVVAALSRRR